MGQNKGETSWETEINYWKNINKKARKNCIVLMPMKKDKAGRKDLLFLL